MSDHCGLSKPDVWNVLEHLACWWICVFAVGFCLFMIKIIRYFTSERIDKVCQRCKSICVFIIIMHLYYVQKSGANSLPVAKCGGGSGLNWDSNVILTSYNKRRPSSSPFVAAYLQHWDTLTCPEMTKAQDGPHFVWWMCCMSASANVHHNKTGLDMCYCPWITKSNRLITKMEYGHND